jgi:hypothetical protein
MFTVLIHKTYVKREREEGQKNTSNSVKEMVEKRSWAESRDCKQLISIWLELQRLSSSVRLLKP